MSLYTLWPHFALGLKRNHHSKRVLQLYSEIGRFEFEMRKIVLVIKVLKLSV